MNDVDLLTENSWDAEREEAVFEASDRKQRRYAYMTGALTAALRRYVQLARPLLEDVAPAHVLAELDDMVDRIETLEKEVLP